MSKLMRLSCALGAAALGCFLVSGLMRSGVKTQGSGGAAAYDTATETSLSGTLAQPPARGRMGLYLRVEEPTGEMAEVKVSPRKYLDARGFSLEQGDQVQITGSRIRVDGAPLVVARLMTKQGRTIELRDAQGHPLWR